MLFPIYHLYLLQLESYELNRYARLLRLKGILPPKTTRQSIVWTTKAKLFFVCSFILWILSGALVGTFLGIFAGIIFGIINFFLFPLWLAIVELLFSPLDSYLKRNTKRKARELLVRSGVKAVIGIIGSYGKTTMKEALRVSLSASGGVFATPDSVNAPVGVSRWILKNAKKDAVLIIEMGEHYKGDIKELCEIAPPDIVLMTGIAESHLERFKTFDVLQTTLLEGTEYRKSNAPIIANGDDTRVMEMLKNINGVSFYGASPSFASHVAHSDFSTERLGWNVSISAKGEKVENLFVPFLGGYVPGLVAGVGAVAQALNLPLGVIRAGLSSIKPVAHRLEPIQGGGGVLVIDDSYNGNPEGAKAAMRLLSRFSPRRRIYLTPGLVEMGKESERIHLELGRELASHADLVMLINTSVAKWIKKGLLESNFPESCILTYESAPSAHADLPNILKEHDVIVFQNDWGDQYV